MRGEEGAHGNREDTLFANKVIFEEYLAYVVLIYPKECLWPPMGEYV